MRFMDIPPFPRAIEIPDFEFFLRQRLSQKVVLWPEQAIPLVGYMGWPNDPEARAASVAILREWSEGSQAVPSGRWLEFEGGVVSGVINLESPGVEAPSGRPRHDERYHEGRRLAA